MENKPTTTSSMIIAPKEYALIEKYNKSIKQSQNKFIKKIIKDTKKGLITWKIENNIATVINCNSSTYITVQLINAYEMHFYSLKVNDWFETEDYKMILPLVVLLKKQQAKEFKTNLFNI